MATRNHWLHKKRFSSQSFLKNTKPDFSLSLGFACLHPSFPCHHHPQLQLWALQCMMGNSGNYHQTKGFTFLRLFYAFCFYFFARELRMIVWKSFAVWLLLFDKGSYYAKMLSALVLYFWILWAISYSILLYTGIIFLVMMAPCVTRNNFQIN